MYTYLVTRKSDGHIIEVEVEQLSLHTGVYRAVIAAHHQLTGETPRMMMALSTSEIEINGVLYLRPVLIQIS